MTFLQEYDLLADDAERTALVNKRIAGSWKELFDELRRECPVFVAPHATLVTLRRDIVDVLQDQSSFTVQDYAEAMDPVVEDFMLARDDARSRREHEALRLLLEGDRPGDLRELVGRLAADALQEAAKHGYVDVVPQLSRLVPLRLCIDRFGIPAPDGDPRILLRWSRAMQEDMFRNPRRDRVVREASVRAGREMADHLSAVVRQQAASGTARGVLARALGQDPNAQARVAPGPRPQPDLDRVQADLAGLLIGSIETTSHAVVQALHHLLTEAGLRQDAAQAAARPDRSAFDAHVWEALRFAPVAVLLRRRCTKDHRLPSGAQVASGTTVLACIASAAFDRPDVEQPDAFDPRRDPPPRQLQLQFGSGPHACLGRAIAEQVVPEIVRQVLLRDELHPLPPPVGAVDHRGGPFPEHYLLSYGAPGPAVPRTADRGPRSTTADGRSNTFELGLMTSGRPLWSVAQALPPVQRRLNRLLVDKAARRMPPRPAPLSTMAPYTSWTSLHDRTYDGRHLEPVRLVGLPDLDRVTPLFQRPPGAGELSTKSTMLFAYFAQWFVDGFLRSDRTPGAAPGRNTSTHALDLCQLYGTTPEATSQLRTGRGGRLCSQYVGEEELPELLCRNGVRRPEFSAISDIALTKEPPETVPDRLFAFGFDRANAQLGPMLFNVLFLREHNRVAGLLEKAHRRDPAWDDERLFETSRNILTVLLIKIVVGDYINHLTPYHFRFQLDPDGFPNPVWYRPNWVSVEFNLLYRWHSLMPTTLALGGRTVPVSRTSYAQQALVEHGLWSLLREAADQPSGRLGLFNTDDDLLPVERASLELGRAVGLQSYNAYRRLCRFPPADAEDFSQISGDRRVQEGLERVYGSVDRVELYVGLFAEDLRPDSVLPPLMGRMVGVDAFSQALTNELLAQRIHGRPETFGGPEGRHVITSTSTLEDIIVRNVGALSTDRFSMTQKGWRPGAG